MCTAGVRVDFNPIASVVALSKPAWIAPLFCMLTLYLQYVGLYFFFLFCNCLISFSVKIYLNVVLIQSQTLRKQIQILELNGVWCYLVLHLSLS